MEWQPRARVLATGWQDGHIACYSISETHEIQCVFQNDKQHSGQ
jgi:hypothetical protein